MHSWSDSDKAKRIEFNENFTEIDDQIGNLSSFINVMAYGAKGDGVTDDTTAIQNAMDAGSYTKRTVYIPEGNYITTQSIVITKDYTQVVCQGRIKNNGTTSAFVLDGADWCNFNGLHVIGGTGSGVEIKNDAKQNIFLNTTFDGISNYGFYINNMGGSGKPSYNAFIGINMIYTYGVIKNIATSNSDFGYEFTLSDVHFTNCPTITDLAAFPAAIWCRHIHDIFIYDLMGASSSGVFLFEGDCNGQMDNFNVTSIQKNTLIITKYGGFSPTGFMITNFLIWGANTDLTGYVDIAAVELYGINSIHLTNGRLSNCKWGIKQGGSGSYFYENMTFNDCDDFIKFDNFPVGEVSVATKMFFNSCHFRGTTKNRNLLNSALPLGYKQAVTVRFNNCYLDPLTVWNFDPLDQCKRVEFNNCDFSTTTLNTLNDLFAFVNNVENDSAPTKGMYQKGYRVKMINPAASGYAERICTAQGGSVSGAWAATTAYTAGTWVSSGGLAWKCITGGTSGTVAPTSGTLGAQVVDGTVTWRYMVNSFATFKGVGLIEA